MSNGLKPLIFTRDSDGLMRIVLTQPYVNCLRIYTAAMLHEKKQEK